MPEILSMDAARLVNQISVQVTVEIVVSRRVRARLWLALQLIRLAVAIGGFGGVKVDHDR